MVEEDWRLVTWFLVEGSQPKVTKSFTCSHVEWQVLWYYIPISGHPVVVPPPPLGMGYDPEPLNVEGTHFNMSVCLQYEDAVPIASIVKTGGEKTSGVISINKSGTFYLKITAANTGHYTVIVEENLASIPEFPSWASLVLAFAIPLVIVLICQRKCMHRQ